MIDKKEPALEIEIENLCTNDVNILHISNFWISVLHVFKMEIQHLDWTDNNK